MNANQLAALEAIKKLTAKEMNALVPEWNRISKMKRAQEAHEVVAKVASTGSAGGFKFGDIITWSSQKRGRPSEQHLKFSNMNRAGTCFVGMECDKAGNLLTPRPGSTGKWTVSVSFLTHVNGTPVAKA